MYRSIIINTLYATRVVYSQTSAWYKMISGEYTGSLFIIL